MEATEGSNCHNKSIRLTRRFPSQRAALQHNIENGEPRAHAGRQHQLLRVPRLTETLREGSNHRIPPRGSPAFFVYPPLAISPLGVT